MKKFVTWGGVAALVVLALWSVGRIIFEDPHVKQGHALYEYYCAHCHGAKGRGDGYNADFMDPRPRDLTDQVETEMADLTNEQIYDTFTRVVKEESDVTNPDEDFIPGSMPTFKYTLSDEERWALVAYVRTLHKNDAPKIDFTKPLSTTRPVVEADAKVDLAALTPVQRDKLVEQGRHLYHEKFMCESCHRIDDKGGKVGPDLSRSGFRLNPQWIYRWTKYPEAIRQDTKMPSFGMTDDEATAITAYLGTLRADKVIAPKQD
jgi:mono/diheme cytochrome c family protein